VKIHIKPLDQSFFYFKGNQVIAPLQKKKKTEIPSNESKMTIEHSKRTILPLKDGLNFFFLNVNLLLQSTVNQGIYTIIFPHQTGFVNSYD